MTTDSSREIQLAAIKEGLPHTASVGLQESSEHTF